MTTNGAALTQHRLALDGASAEVRGLRPGDLDRPSPCTGWDLRALLEHMIGQNHGFAEAVEGPQDAPAPAFAPRSIDDAGLVEAWEESADRIAAAFAAAPGEREVLLVEVAVARRFPLATVLGIHLLDTVVHTWDIATTVGRDFRPNDEVVEYVARLAAAVPAGPARERPGSAFAPAVSVPAGADSWSGALALLGRRG
jgi:uncharacterized protein (TIGR03086 family)